MPYTSQRPGNGGELPLDGHGLITLQSAPPFRTADVNAEVLTVLSIFVCARSNCTGCRFFVRQYIRDAFVRR